MKVTHKISVTLSSVEVRFALAEYARLKRPGLFDGHQSLNVELLNEAANISQIREIPESQWNNLASNG